MRLCAQVKFYTFVLKNHNPSRESYSKEEETRNEGELNEECDYYDGMTERHSLVVRHLLEIKGEEDWRRTSIF